MDTELKQVSQSNYFYLGQILSLSLHPGLTPSTNDEVEQYGIYQSYRRGSYSEPEAIEMGEVLTELVPPGLLY